ncbi:methyl-accepting chemotaxis protein [Desulfatiferula olefinivorans]
MPTITHHMALILGRVFSGATWIRHRLAGDIGALIVDLTTLMDGTETRFLDLGRRFQDIHQKAGDVTARVIQCLDLIRSGDDASGLTGLTDGASRFVEALFDQQAAIGKRLDAVKDIGGALAKLSGLCDESNHIVLLLNVIALNIGIESRRCDASQDMFTVFTEEVRALAVDIGQVAADLDREAQDIRRDHRAALNAGQAHLVRMSELARAARNDMEQAARTLTGLMDGTCASMDAAADCVRRIGDRAAEIVVALQFHDIVRQKIDHIIAALTEAADQLKGPSVRFAWRGGRDRIRFAVTVLRIQERQLSGIYRDIADAVDGMARALEGIDDQVAGLYRQSPGLSTGDNPGGEDPVERLSACLKSLSGVRDECLTLSEAVTDQVTRGAAAAARLQRHVAAVKRISLELHRKALNAVIKAAHLGDRGRSIEVFAQEVTTSSRAANDFVEQVIRIIGTVQSLTDGLLADDRSGGSSLDADDGYDLTRGMDDLARIRQTVASHREAMVEPLAGLEKAIGQTREHRAFFSGRLKDLDALIRRLSPMIAEGSAAAGLDSSPAPAPGMIRTDHYTMESERRAHEQALSATDEPDAPAERKIPAEEDIGEQQADGEGESPKRKESEDFGDNVELF